MKPGSLSFAFVLALGLFLAACSAPATPTAPTAAPPPTDTPAAAASDPWTVIQETGILRVGTAADYPPFSFYNDDGQLDGFEVALIRDLAGRLGLTAEVQDFAFDGLIGAVYIDQIDVAIAAISITPERSSLVDFTSLYYTGSDGILARPDSGIKVNTPNDMAGKRVATQRGTAYEEWVQTSLVEPGLITSEQYFAYDRPENAVRDLKEDRVDLVILDLLPAREAAQDGSVILAGSSLIPQQFAMANPKGSQITAELNRALSEAQADGTVGRLVQEYLKVSAPPPPVNTPTPLPQPPATPVPPACVNGMALVADLSYPDQNMTNPPVVQPGTAFAKGWRVRNTGTCNWDPSFRLVYQYGNVPAAQMSGNPVAVPSVVPPGGEVDLYANLVAPFTPGVYQGFWQMVAPDGVRFGQTVWVGIWVPGAQPTLPVQPDIANFYTSPGSIPAGQCAVLGWTVRGDVSTVDLTLGNTMVWRDAPFSGTHEECLGRAGTYRYTLTASGPGGTVAENVTVSVYAP